MKAARIRFLVLLLALFGQFTGSAISQDASSERVANASTATRESASTIYEAEIGSTSIFARAWQSGFVVFSVLLILIVLSVLSWGVSVAKYYYLAKLDKTGSGFVKSFWESRSLNDLNGRLGEYPYSPVREVFRIGYAELVRGTQMRDQSTSPLNAVIVNAALDNLGRSLVKAKQIEKRRMERFLSLLAISASASPFIGLFGTVWGIMTAFESIAKSGSASLAAVAPGISEALIATAFGLAAAIPAVIGYNIAAAKIRGLMIQIDGFTADFLNIVERYMVSDKGTKSASVAPPAPDQL
jgi:biopolymer transport protein TolQ